MNCRKIRTQKQLLSVGIALKLLIRAPTKKKKAFDVHAGKKKMKRCLEGNASSTSNDTEEHFNRQIFDSLNVSICVQSVVIE